MLFYEEIRNKIRNSSNSSKNKNRNKININNQFYSKKNKSKKISYINTNSKNITKMKKANSFFISKKIQELKNLSNIIKMKNQNILENNLKHINNKQNKKCSYNIQNFYNNYPRPEPFPKKIDIKIINNNSNFNRSNFDDMKNFYKTKDIYDDKKILFILTNLGLENLFCKFRDNFITYKDLNFLTKDDFIEMKIPIGPRNRIIHFIEELKKNGINLNFEELRNFIEKYKKLISEHIPKIENEKNNNYNEKDKKNEMQNIYSNKYVTNKNIRNNSFDLSSQSESAKNENTSFFDKNNISNNNSFFSNNKFNKNVIQNYFSFNKSNKNDKKKMNRFFINNNSQKFYLSENDKNDKLKEKKSNNINKIKNNILNNILNNKTHIKNYQKRNSNSNISKSKTENIFFKKTYNYDYEYIKISNSTKNDAKISKYKESIPKIKNQKKHCIKVNKKSISKKNINKNIKNNQNYSFLSINSSLSKNLLNKLDMINKEVENYENNYKRLKKETKRRKKNVIRILSNNYIDFKNIQYFNKYNKSCHEEKRISFFDNK